MPPSSMCKDGAETTGPSQSFIILPIIFVICTAFMGVVVGFLIKMII